MADYSDIKFSGTSAQEPSFRNIIINGDMSIAQRGTSVSGISTTQIGSLDRFQMLTQTAGSAVFTMSQDTDVPSGQGFAKSQKIDVTTALDPYASSNLTIFRQRIEGQNLQYLKKGTSNAESLTCSFWVKSNKTGTYICELLDSDNSNRHINKSYTISSANTWEKKTITFAGDTTGGTLNNDNGVSLDLGFWLGAGTTYTSGTLQTSWGANTSANRAVGQVNLADSTSNEWYITGVQLEAGTTASDFEFLPFDTQLQRCQRYYQKSFDYGTTPVDNSDKFEYHRMTPFQGSSTSGLISYYKTEMRVIPTVTLYTTAQSPNGTGKISFYTGSWTNGDASIQSGSSSKFFHISGGFTDMLLAQYNYEAEAEL